MFGIGYGYEQQDEYDMAAEVWRQKATEASERAAWARLMEDPALRDVMPCRPGERLSEHDCPNQCGAQLIMLMVDRLYYCRRCEQEFEFSEIDRQTESYDEIDEVSEDEGSWDDAYFTDGAGETHHVANMELGNSDY